MGIELTCRNFADDGSIPRRYTCDGENLSPPLMWSGLPEGTRSVALVCEEPEATNGPFAHWLVYNIPVLDHTLPEGIPPWKAPGEGMLQGTNDFGGIGYGGPCPTGGTHRYVFTLYALDAPLEVEPGLLRQELDQAMEGHILDTARLTGLYRS